ncbi:MAG: formate dehydrogenase [Rhizobiales bacterium 64-17]|nr:MAG: formate dehydrogenase [Rhizobiales bacterium 64-17]
MHVFGAGGGTSSYREAEDADLLVFWGSNAREAHPIFFHHALKAIHKGAKVYAVDPRRAKTAEWADAWLGLDVGTDVALAYGIGREIIHAGLVNEAFVANATTGFEEYIAACEPWTLEVTSRETGVPADLIRQLAHDYAKAERAQICWTLGITEHHNGTDNVRSLCNLALLTGHVGRWGSGLVPLRGQNNVQGGGDMGAIPKNLPGFQDVGNADHRAKFERLWNVTMPPKYGMTLSEMMHAMDEGHLTNLYIIGENPVQSDADSNAVGKRLENLDHVVVQDIFLTKTASYADVVLPSTAAWCESEGTFTNSERRVQLVRKALEPPGSAKDDIEIMRLIAERLGRGWPEQTAEQIWDELRAVSPRHHGMSYRLLAERGGLQWPFPDENGPESPFLHGRLWEKDPEKRGQLAPFGTPKHSLPVDKLDDEFPLRLTTGRRLTDYNTGVQSGGFNSPIRFGACVDLSPEDMARLDVNEGEWVRISSRRGSVLAPVRREPGLRPGLLFMACNFPDEVDVNALTIEANDPISGTAEFKATAVKVEKTNEVPTWERNVFTKLGREKQELAPAE